MDAWDYFKIGIAYCVGIGIICFFVLALILPKPHQGYYLDVKYDSQVYPVFKIYNNWKWHFDTTAFVTPVHNVCLQVFEKLTK